MSNYSLLQYLLLASESQINKTFFVFVRPKVLGDYVGKILTNSVCLPDNELVKNWKNRIKVFMRFWWIPLTRIYANDFSHISSWLIGSAKYICLEDGPGVFQSVIESHYEPFDVPKFTKFGIPTKWKFGRIYGKKYGYNNQCTLRYVSEDSDLNTYILKGRKYEMFNVESRWNKIPQTQKLFIAKVFNISNQIQQVFQNVGTVILTQPLIEDCGFDDTLILSIYGPWIDKFRQDEIVIIKPHPRDEVDYKKYYATEDNVKVLRTKAPMQLLDAMGLKPKRAITICSSSITTYKNTNTEIIWLGTHIHPKIKEHFGNFTLM